MACEYIWTAEEIREITSITDSVLKTSSELGSENYDAVGLRSKPEKIRRAVRTTLDFHTNGKLYLFGLSDARRLERGDTLTIVSSQHVWLGPPDWAYESARDVLGQLSRLYDVHDLDVVDVMAAGLLEGWELPHLILEYCDLTSGERIEDDVTARVCDGMRAIMCKWATHSIYGSFGHEEPIWNAP